MTASSAGSRESFILALETATPVCGVALLRTGGTVASSILDVGLRHSRLLFTEIERLLAAAGSAPAQLSHVAVSIGPGSFTGLRLGLSAAKGICLPRNTPLLPVRTLQALAARLPYALHPVCAVMDARKGQVYAALYDTRSGWPEILSEEQALAPEELIARRQGLPTIYTGPGADICAALLDDRHGQAIVAPPYSHAPDAAVVGHLAGTGLATGRMAGLQGQAMETLEPVYLRPPEAALPVGRQAGTLGRQ